MELELRSATDPAVVEAVRRALRMTGLGERRPTVSPWRAAALAEGAGGDRVTRPEPQAPSPRSTRGATRA
jgi:hypothetical protein